MNQPSRRQFLKLAGSAAALTGLAQIVGCDPTVTCPPAAGPAPAPQTQYVCDEEVSFFLDQNEKMDNQRQTLTALDMPRLLQKTNVATPFSVSQVNQYLHFGPFPANHPLTSSVLYGPNELDQVGNFLYFRDADRIFEHELSFENGIESQLDAPGTTLVDLIGMQVPILGDTYELVKAKRVNTLLDLEFIAGTKRTQAQGTTIKHVIGNKEYDVTVVYADPSTKSAQYIINGENTLSLGSGAWYPLADGTMIGQGVVKDNGTDFVTDLFFNADVMGWFDDDVTDGLESTLIPQRNGVPITDARVRITGAPLPNGNFELSGIRYNQYSDSKLGDIYIAKGQSLRENNANPLSIPGKKLDIDYLGMTEQGKHVVRVCNNRMPLQQ